MILIELPYITHCIKSHGHPKGDPKGASEGDHKRDSKDDPKGDPNKDPKGEFVFQEIILI